MSAAYNPDANAYANGTWDVTFLSDRDVSADVPINFVPHPGVDVTAACFGNRVYNDGPAENCLSNLLSSQIRRFVIDVYWDTVSRQFGLCPVEIPAASSESGLAAESSTINANEVITPRDLSPRQTISVPVSSNFTVTTSSTTPTTTSSAPFSTVSAKGTFRLLQIGPYQCSNTLNLASLTSIFNQYNIQTSNNLEARVVTWILNLHVAATAQDPLTARTTISAGERPNNTETISSYLNAVKGSLYTPTSLFNDRQNLNSSWLRQVDGNTVNGYYTTIGLSNGDIATEDGWPGTGYIQTVRGKQMLIGFGAIDIAMSAYDTEVDGDLIYPPAYLTRMSEISIGVDGTLNEGCYYDSSEFAVQQINNSWASAPINNINPTILGDLADNLTTCGFSQVLNVTIDDRTADDQPESYQSFGNNAIFGWAYGEPQNDSSIGADRDDKFRCAILVSTDAFRGHWRVDYCNARHRVACREASQPYRWRLSGYSVPFAAAEEACTGNTTFSIPRTGLENTYLYQKVLGDARDDNSLLDGVWVNFNALEYENCWVTTGVNGSCPYYQDSSATQSRHILITSLAALIVLIVTALTILVKCSANARNSRMRKRGEGGWDYEGVPS